MKALKAVIVSLLVVGSVACTTQEKVVKEIETIEVKVPFYIPCDEPAPASPILYTEMLTSDSDFYDKVKAVLAENKELEAYTVRLRASLDACKAKGTHIIK